MCTQIIIMNFLTTKCFWLEHKFVNKSDCKKIIKHIIVYKIGQEVGS